MNETLLRKKGTKSRMRGQVGRMFAFLLILLAVVGIIAGASWFYQYRIATADNGAGAIVIILMTVALLVVVSVGAAKMMGER